MNAGTRKSPATPAATPPPPPVHVAAVAAGAAHAPRFSLTLTIIAFAMVLLGLLWGAVIVKLDVERDVEITNATKDTANLALAFEEHTKRTIQEVDQLLLFIMDLRKQSEKPDLRRLMEDGPVLSRIYTYLSIIDEHGNLVSGSRPFQPVNLSDREHFQVHVAQDTGRLFISKPVIGRASGKLSIQFSRRINKPDLSFGGVVVASVDPGYFSRFYGQLDLGKGSVITLVGRDDAIVRARRAGTDTTIGQDLDNSVLLSHLRTSESGSYVTTSAVDGVTRIASYRTLADYPLVVFVGLAQDEVLAAFNQRRRTYYGAAALASLVILGFTVLLIMLISRRERSEKALRESEQRFRAMFDHAGIGIAMRSAHDRNLPWTQVNDHFCKLLGYTREELLKLSTAAITPPDEQRPAVKDNERLLRGEITNYVREKQVMRKDGRRIWVNLAVAALPDTEGRSPNLLAVYQDITGRKRAEHDRVLLAAIVEHSNDAIISRGLDGTIRSWNASAARMFGWTEQEAVGQPITILVPPDRRGELRPLIERVMAGETIGAVESGHVRKDGARIDSSVTFSAIKNAAGAVTGIALIYRDITVQKRLQREALHKATLTQLMESLARTVNEAAGPEDAMRLCLKHIAEYGRWKVARFARFDPRSQDGIVHSSIWHMPDSSRYSELLSHSAAISHSRTQGWFVGQMLREKKPVWIADISRLPEAGRLTLAATAGLRTAFGFPIIAHGQVIAFLEFFAEDIREPDAMLLESIGGVGSQLARLIERHQAESALRISEARMRAVLDAEPECVKVVAADGSPVDINRAGLAMFEAESVEQVRRHGLLNFVLPEQQALFSEHFGKALAGESSMLEFQMVGLKGTHRWLESHATPMLLPDSGATAMLAVTRDITERKQAQEHIAYLSQYDVLTGLPNRNLFRDRLELAIARARRQGEVVGIMLLNLDRFRLVNENLGLEAGDDLLRQVSARLKTTLRDVDTIARLGNDEFAILAEGVPASADVTAIAEKLIEAFTLPFMLQGTEVITLPSIGITIYPNGTDDCDKLLEHAETAMERLKREGGGGYWVYEEEPVTHHGQRFDLEMRLRHALERGELELHYQPKVQLQTGAVTGVEALLRWNNPDLGAVSPARFIPVAEESGLIVPIGEWVLRTACAQMQSWHAQGHAIGIAVNLSPRQFRQNDLAGAVASVLQETGLAPEYLELEITEGTAMTNADRAIKMLNELHALGVKLSVDDFGTGYSSLAYLKRFPLDSLKIDRSFVIDVGSDANSEAIMRATIALAHSLNLKVVAEGVETVTQRDFLAAAGCNEIQGYLYSRPLPADEFLHWLDRPVTQAVQSVQN